MNDPIAIPLTQGKLALVDAADLALISQYRWYAWQRRDDEPWYALARGADWLLMHRLILPDFPQLDHKNGNGLDNRRANLRPATTSQNMANSKKRLGTSSRFKGVSWHQRDRRWVASICINYETTSLGSFRNEEEAAREYDEAAKEYFGEYARLNFP